MSPILASLLNSPENNIVDSKESDDKIKRASEGFQIIVLKIKFRGGLPYDKNSEVL